MTALLNRLGADDAASFLLSEQRENIPQVAHFLFVHEVRKILAQLHMETPDWNASPRQTSPERVMRAGDEAARELKLAGASPAQIDAIYRRGVCDALARMLGLLDGTYAIDAEDEPLAPLWRLVETVRKPGAEISTGRTIGGSHEYFEALYPDD